VPSTETLVVAVMLVNYQEPKGQRSPSMMIGGGMTRAPTEIDEQRLAAAAATEPSETYASRPRKEERGKRR